MNQGVGSFNDYNVWAESFAQRKRVNAESDSLRDRLWKAFDL